MIVKINNVIWADFNVDPDRPEGDLSATEIDLSATEMKFEASMHCAVQGHIGEKSSSTIRVTYTQGKWRGNEREQRSESIE